jgi:hypothetical protein
MKITTLEEDKQTLILNFIYKYLKNFDILEIKEFLKKYLEEIKTIKKFNYNYLTICTILKELKVDIKEELEIKFQILPNINTKKRKIIQTENFEENQKLKKKKLNEENEIKNVQIDSEIKKSNAIESEKNKELENEKKIQNEEKKHLMKKLEDLKKLLKKLDSNNISIPNEISILKNTNFVIYYFKKNSLKHVLNHWNYIYSMMK